MKNISCKLLLVFLLLFSVALCAQAQYTLSGKVTDEAGQPVSGATVFISGSQRITATDATGSYNLNDVDAGTMQLSVKMLGFMPYTKNILVQDKSIVVDIPLVIKPIVLNEVTIGNGEGREANLKLFKRQFFGDTPNGDACVITNPDVITFGTRKGTNGKLILSAESDDFMVIENKALGYRINYLLKSFTTTGLPGVTNYDGDCSFTEMEGTTDMKKQWAENRLDAYRGSLMHYLRSVFSNTTLDQGFLTYSMYVANGKRFIDKREVKFDTLVTAIDTSFISLKFKAFYVIYDPKKAAKTKLDLAKGIEQPAPAPAPPAAATTSTSSADAPPQVNKAVADLMKQKGMDIKTITIKPASTPVPVNMNENNSQGGSQLILTLKDVIIDAKGRFNDFRAFLIRENWVENRIGDKLPFEYQPPAVAN